ncbi:MAG TPA: sigma-E factor regulatory protein RseB domain-containing protein, partial [Candidatus Saccharimonadia bacterium]|nr:sigma-E factor regulatory protein RseB domain-containing protein [Candidatus Saccharimonadia bacterium]
MTRAFAVLLACFAGGVTADEAAESWLSRMAAAHAAREYEGTFIYIHDGRIETMRVVRTIGPDGPRDTVASLTGELREVVRGDGELRTSGNGVTTVVPSGPAVVFHVAPPGLLHDATHYRLGVIGEDRVAGYPTT